MYISKGKMIVGSLVSLVLAAISAWCALIAFAGIIMMIHAAVTGKSLDTDIPAVAIGFAIFFIPLLVAMLRRLKTAFFAVLVNGIFEADTDGHITVAELVKKRHMTEQKWVRYFRWALEKGYLKNCTLHFDEELYVSLNNGMTDAAEKFDIVKCPGCSANNKIRIGFEQKCSYCGQIISVGMAKQQKKKRKRKKRAYINEGRMTIVTIAAFLVWIVNGFFVYLFTTGYLLAICRILDGQEDVWPGEPIAIALSFFAVLFGISSWLLLLVKRLSRYNAAFEDDADGVIDVEKLCHLQGIKNRKRFVEELYAMKNLGFMIHFSLSGKMEYIILQQRDEKEAGFTVCVCDSCGAENKVRFGFVQDCKYCGSRIEAKNAMQDLF